MKKIMAFLLVAVMCFSLVACGGDATKKPNREESAVVTVENWEDYLEIGVKTDNSDGVLMYSVYLKAKEGIAISNEINTEVYFSYNMSKQHYTIENNKVILGECESIEETYTDSFVMYSNQNKEGYYYEKGDLKGAQWNLQGGNYWALIPGNFVITEIEGTITVSK